MPEGQALLDLRAAGTELGRTVEFFHDMLAFLDAGEPARVLATELMESCASAGSQPSIHPLSDVQLLAPLPRPRSIRDCLAFEQHYIGAMRTIAKWKFGPLAALDRGVARMLGRGFLRPPKVWYERPIYYKGNPASVVGHDAEVHWPSFTRKLDFELELAIVIGRTGRNIPAERASDWIAGSHCDAAVSLGR